MRLDAIEIKKESQLIADYKNNKDIIKFFDYKPYEALEQRLEDLKKRTFRREELVMVLEQCNKAWGAGNATLEAIKKLKDPNAVVVVGGQQAGILTGPLYTLNKIISILQLARKQEEALGAPVLPVFWIAGEDHDYEEINHVYMPQDIELKKHKFPQVHYKKNPVSEISLNKDIGEEWLEEIFSFLPETVHTREIHTLTATAWDHSDSFTDFFARLIHSLFPDEGLILMDAADKNIRRLENDYFIELIENQPKISEGVCRAAELLNDRGYPTALELELSDGHLFYHLNGERVLLKRTEEGSWVGKQNEIELSTEEMLDIAAKQPENLSNNVVTRPVMQEMLLPTLAFIGGPGEISYWAYLKPAFHALDLKMPPVVPRLSFTFVTEKARKALAFTKISLDEAVQEGSRAAKGQWLAHKQEPPIGELAEELKETIKDAHGPIRKMADEIRPDIGELAEKNLTYLWREVDFLRKRMEKAMEEKYDKELEQFDWIEMMLRPEGGFQERTWNVLPFLNWYGLDFLTELSRSNCSFQHSHYAVQL